MSINNLALCLIYLNQKDQVFAKSLIECAERNPLSEKQEYWVKELINRAAISFEQKQTAVQTTVSVQGIIELIRRNNNAKRPKIRFLVNDVEFVISVASSSASIPGSLNIVSSNQWFGRIHLDGKYEASRKISEDKHADVVKSLTVIAADPTKAAADFGKKTGRCCFCSLHLDDAKSLEVGYGPICAKRYKLPWGNLTTLEKIVMIKELTDKQAFG